MKGQKGQSVVEFALIVPLLLMLVLWAIYGAFVYADYLQYSNAIRDAARDIAVQKDNVQRAAIKARLDREDPRTVEKYASSFTSLYRPDFSVQLEDADEHPVTQWEDASFVKVTVTFTLNDNSSILPDSLPERSCTMPIEKELYAGETSGDD